MQPKRTGRTPPTRRRSSDSGDPLAETPAGARALQSATISFGLVSIPVQVYPAANPAGTISFNLLHKCGSRVKQEYRCLEEDKIVPRDELVKGFEFEKEKYVTFSKEELKALNATASELITIDQFLPASKIDPIYYESTYFLGPGKNGSKPYGLLLAAMRKAGKTAIGRWAARGKQYLVALRPGDDGIVMQQLFYASELRSQKALDIREVEVKQQELDLATQLIDSISVDEWKPEQFTDEVQGRIREQIQRKVEGKEIVAPEAPVGPGGAQVIDLMEALRASLKRGRPGSREASPAMSRSQASTGPAARRTTAKRTTRKAA
jgi:DNA end-binding protein Ku